MTSAVFAIPGDITLPTGGYAYDRRVLALQPDFGLDVRHLALPGSFPNPTATDLQATERLLAATAADDILLIDGLAYGAMPAELVRRLTRKIVALVHHPLCLEAGLSPDAATRLKLSETAALALARQVIATSPTTARTLAEEFGVPADRITVAVPGTNPAQRATGTGSPLRLLAVGSVVPRKGYGVLIEALAPLRSLDWTLDIVGVLDRGGATADELRASIAAMGLSQRVRVLGAVGDARLESLYAKADLFVMSSLYEGFGMVLTEALARGLPIVCTTGGAAAETIPNDAALKVPPGDPRALMWALGRVIEDAGLRRALSDKAWAAAQALTRWDDTARIIADVIKGVAA